MQHEVNFLFISWWYVLLLPVMFWIANRRFEKISFYMFIFILLDLYTIMSIHKIFITFLTSEACNRILLFWLNTWLKIGLRRINWSSSTNEIPSPRKDGINIVVHDFNDALSWQWCNYTFYVPCKDVSFSFH